MLWVAVTTAGLLLPAQAASAAPDMLSDSTHSVAPATVVLGMGAGFGRNTFASGHRLSYVADTYALSVHLLGHRGALASGFWSELGVLYGLVIPSNQAIVTLSAGLAYVEGSNDADFFGFLNQVINADEPDDYTGLGIPISFSVSEPLLGPLGFGGHVFNVSSG